MKRLIDRYIILPPLKRLANICNLMVRDCAWCYKILGFKKAYGTKGVTSGICRQCKTKQLEKLDIRNRSDKTDV